MRKGYLLGTSALLVVASVAFVAFKVCAEKKIVPAATVNGETITVEEIKKSYESNPQIAAQVPFDQFYEKAVNIFVDGKLIYQAAQKAGVENTPEYQEQLKTMKEDLARKIYFEKIVAEKVNPTAVQAYYDNEYLKNFKSQKEAKAKHILVADEASAKEVIAKLNKGENFDDLAKEYSKEPAELGYFTENLMVPEFAKAAFALKKGTYSKTPVKTQFGYHVILTEDFRDSTPLPLKDLESHIANYLSQKELAKAYDNLIAGADIKKYGLDGKELIENKSEDVSEK